MDNLRRRTLCSSGGIDPVTGRGVIDGYEVVDLGLPSGTLWATCNIGASTETEEGKLFMWGSTVGFYRSAFNPCASSHYYRFMGNPYTYYDPSYTNLLFQNGLQNWLTVTAHYSHNNGYHECFPDIEYSKYIGSTLNEYAQFTLDDIDDAAYVNMGNQWRMPSGTQYEELFNETYQGFVQDSISGKTVGVTFTSRYNSTRILYFPLMYCEIITAIAGSSGYNANDVKLYSQDFEFNLPQEGYDFVGYQYNTSECEGGTFDSGDGDGNYYPDVSAKIFYMSINPNNGKPYPHIVSQGAFIAHQVRAVHV